MAKFWKDKVWWKAVSDLIIIIVLIGILTGWITQEFRPVALIFLFIGLVVTLNFIIQKMLGK